MQLKELAIKGNNWQELGSTESYQMKNVVGGGDEWLLNRSAVLISRRHNEIEDIGVIPRIIWTANELFGPFSQMFVWPPQNFTLQYLKAVRGVAECSILLLGFS